MGDEDTQAGGRPKRRREPEAESSDRAKRRRPVIDLTGEGSGSERADGPIVIDDDPIVIDSDDDEAVTTRVATANHAASDYGSPDLDDFRGFDRDLPIEIDSDSEQSKSGPDDHGAARGIRAVSATRPGGASEPISPRVKQEAEADELVSPGAGEAAPRGQGEAVSRPESPRMPIDDDDGDSEDDDPLPKFSDVIRHFSMREEFDTYFPERKWLPYGPGKFRITCGLNGHVDSDPSLIINDDRKGYHWQPGEIKGTYYCFPCQAGGSAVRYIKDILGRDWREAVDKYNSDMELIPNEQRALDSPPPLDAAGGPARQIEQHPSRSGASRRNPGRLIRLQDRPDAPEARPRTAEEIEFDEMRRWEMAAAMREAARRCNAALYDPSVANQEARAYLQERQLWDQVQKYQIGLMKKEVIEPMLATYRKDVLIEIGLFKQYDTGLSCTLNNRIVFPWCDEKGSVVGLTGRIFGNIEKYKWKKPDDYRPAKYKNTITSPIFRKKELIWSQHHASEAIAGAREIVVVEGYTDVISLHKSGMGNVVSPIGIAISEAQREKLFRLNDHLVVCLDGDDPGQAASVRVAKQMKEYLDQLGPERARGKSMSFAVLPKGKDPDEILQNGGIAAFREAISERISLDDMIDPERRARRIAEIREARGETAADQSRNVTPAPIGNATPIHRLNNPNASRRNSQPVIVGANDDARPSSSRQIRSPREARDDPQGNARDDRGRHERTGTGWTV